MKKPKVLQPVLVEWLDASVGGHGWDYPAAQAKASTLGRCRSVGFLIKASPRLVVLAQNESIADFGQVADTMTIPRACVRRIRRLK